MLFKIIELKRFLSSVTKYKIENIYIKSKKLQLTINTLKNKNKLLINSISSSAIINKASIDEKSLKTNKTKDYSILNKEQHKYFTIISPMIGTFYRSPAPNEAPFIDINDTVKIKQTVCIIEAMKLMNEIESEVNGHIAEILVEDGNIVDCGQALIRIKQDEKNG